MKENTEFNHALGATSEGFVEKFLLNTFQKTLIMVMIYLLIQMFDY